MKIYTKTGDRGDTGLIGGKRVRKSDGRVAAYGDVDETNCWIGANSQGPLSQDLATIQQELFVVGAILAGQKAQVPAGAVDRLEKQIDTMTSELPELRRFILPRGPLHVARAVCRRAERAVVGLPDPPSEVVVYLNRLSDWLFTAARWQNMKAGTPEIEWEGL